MRARIPSRSMSSRVKLYMPSTSRLRSFLLCPLERLAGSPGSECLIPHLPS
jgi:hypothetical protein